MWDSIRAREIPTFVRMVGGYLDGPLSKWSPADWARFPGAQLVGISATGDTWATADVFDVERFDISPLSLPGLLIRARGLGRWPTAYCNSYTWPTVRGVIAAAGLPPPPYFIAQYDASPVIPPDWVALGCVAKQYQSLTQPLADLSVVADYWPGVDPVPTDQQEAALWASL